MSDESHRHGTFQEEACPTCGRFVSDANAFTDIADRSNEDSQVLRFCSEAHADQFHARKQRLAASGNFDELVQSVRMLPKGQRPTDSFILDVIDKHLRAKFGDRA